MHESAARLLLVGVDSWRTGINPNIAGRNKYTFMAYAGGATQYCEKFHAIAANAYEDFVLGRAHSNRAPRQTHAAASATGPAAPTS